MPDDPSQQRAYQRGLEAAQNQSTLDAHEKRLAAINGSIARSGAELSKIHACLDDLMADLKTRAAVELALSNAVKEAADSQLTARHLYIATGMFLLAVAGLFLGAK